MSDAFNQRLALRAKFYPEIRAGGYAHNDGGVEFFLRIRSLLKDTDVVLDLGAGRGAGIAKVLPEFRRNLMILRGACLKVVGVDVEPAVLQNPYLDEAYVVQIGEKLPFADETFDMIYSDWTLEHVADPATFVAEVRRLLKPGGWFCARTPNAMSYQGMVTRLIPNRVHVSLLRWLQPGREGQDVFVTEFKMNSMRDLHRLFPKAGWDLVAYAFSPEPSYVGNSTLLWRFTALLNWLSPPSYRPFLNIFVQKRAIDQLEDGGISRIQP
jgi:SAM-dependent methyltransferase